MLNKFEAYVSKGILKSRQLGLKSISKANLQIQF